MFKQPLPFEPLVTVCIVLYNQSRYIYDCLDSVLKQDYSNLQLIVCDDASYDFDCDALKCYIQENKKENLKSFKVFSQPENVGTVRNCNKAFALADGEIVKLLAGDDMLYDERSVSAFTSYFKDVAVNLLCCRGKCCQNDGTPTDVMYPDDNQYDKLANYSTDELLYQLCTNPWSSILAPTVVFRKAFYNDMGGFDENFRLLEDWPFWIRVCDRDVRIHFSKTMVIWYRYGGVSSEVQNLNFNHHFREAYMRECERMLLGPAMEVVERKMSRFAQIRCRMAAVSFQVQRVQAFDWPFMGFAQRLMFTVKMMPFRFYNIFKNRIDYHSFFNPHFVLIELLILIACCFLQAFGATHLWSWNIEAALSLLILSFCVVAAVHGGFNCLMWILFRYSAYRYRRRKVGSVS